MSKTVHLGVKHDQCACFIHKLLAAKIVTPQQSGDETVENSILGAWKEPGISQCLIWAGNRSNLLLKPELSPVKWPSLDIVASLFLDDNHKLQMEGCEISRYKNHLSAPREVAPLLRIPRISAEALELSDFVGNLTPCLTLIPMGAKFSVALAQAVTTAVLR